jgi:hypothetical protein
LRDSWCAVSLSKASRAVNCAPVGRKAHSWLIRRTAYDSVAESGRPHAIAAARNRVALTAWLPCSQRHSNPVQRTRRMGTRHLVNARGRSSYSVTLREQKQPRCCRSNASVRNHSLARAGLMNAAWSTVIAVRSSVLAHPFVSDFVTDEPPVTPIRIPAIIVLPQRIAPPVSQSGNVSTPSCRKTGDLRGGDPS